MSRKILITGAAGFLGSHLADRFIALGDRVVGVDNMIGGTLENVSSEVEFYQIDCGDLDAMTRIMRGVDLVYHCAATAYEVIVFFAPFYYSEYLWDYRLRVDGRDSRKGKTFCILFQYGAVWYARVRAF